MIEVTIEIESEEKCDNCSSRMENKILIGNEEIDLCNKCLGRLLWALT